MKTALAFALLLFGTPALAAPNPGVLYPDGSRHYAIGFSGIDPPTIRVQRGQQCLITLAPGERLTANGALIADRVRWTALKSYSGGALRRGHHVPIVWSIAVQPSADAQRTSLTIQTDMGSRYLIHLLAVGQVDGGLDPSAQEIVGFYFFHPIEPPRRIARRQASTVRRSR